MDAGCSLISMKILTVVLLGLLRLLLRKLFLTPCLVHKGLTAGFLGGQLGNRGRGCLSIPGVYTHFTA